jgi:hypothetical protein
MEVSRAWREEVAPSIGQFTDRTGNGGVFAECPRLIWRAVQTFRGSPSLETQARGVGHFSAMPAKVGVGLSFRPPYVCPWLSVAVGVSQDEQALSPMACANFLRAEDSFRNPVTQSL